MANNVLVTLSSSAVVTPNYWSDPRSGINYVVAVQTPQNRVDSVNNLMNTSVTPATAGPPQLLSNLATLERREVPAVVSKLITQNKVVALLGEVASSRSLAAAPLAQNAKIPMISPSSTNPEVTKKGNFIFRMCYLDDFQAVFDRLADTHGLDPRGDLVNRFFGLNAAGFLGLRAGEAPRKRLDAFHRGQPPPAWMAKVDRARVV